MKTKKLRFYLMTLILGLFSWTANAATVTKTVGTGGNYTTLKAAFDALNTNTGPIYNASDDVVLQITGSLAETAQPVLNQGTWATFKIYPTVSGVQITGSFANALIGLNGADNVTIDGAVGGTGSTKDMVIHHTQQKGALVFYGDATYSTVKNCTLKGAPNAATSGVVYLNTTSSTTGNDNITITNNNITGGSGGRPYFAVYAVGKAGGEADNLTISNNNIYDIVAPSGGLSAAIYFGTLVGSATISGNSIYETGAVSVTPTATQVIAGIYISGTTAVGNFTISGNYIGGSAANCSGTMDLTVATASTYRGTYYAMYFNPTVTTGTTSVQGNTIAGIKFTNPANGSESTYNGGFYGMFFGTNYGAGSTINVGGTSGNTIGSSSTTGSIVFNDKLTAGGSYAYGIVTNTAGGATIAAISNNTIGGITANPTSATVPVSIIAIEKKSSNAVTISNNLIGSNTTANSIQSTGTNTPGTAAQYVIGIRTSNGDALTCTGNVIRNLTNACSYVGAAATVLQTAGIIANPSAAGTGAWTITGNTILNLSCAASSKASGYPANVVGISDGANSGTGVHTIEGNTVGQLTASATDFTGYMYGIVYSTNNTATTNSISKNFVYGMTAPNLSGAQAIGTGARITGISATATGVNEVHTIGNNIVSLMSDVDNLFSGIEEISSTASVTSKIQHNTVYIGGTVAAGVPICSSYCLMTNSTPTRNFQNNILMCDRVLPSGGSGLSYCIFHNPSANGNLTENYNNYWVPVTGATTRAYLGKYSGSTTITTIGALQTAIAKDANSISTNPNFTLSSPTIATDYKSTVTLTGTDVSISTDYSGATRAASAYQMGAWDASAASAPAAPTITSVTPSNTSLSVAFTAGANNGSAISNYQYSTDGTNYTACSPAQTTSPISITSLTNGTTYPVTIKAVNGIGASIASNSISGTPATTASAPTITAASLNNGTCTVTFTAPSSNGGASISNYKYSTDGTNYTALSPAQTSSPLSIPLVNGSNYTVYIKAVNAAGDGTASASFAANQTVPGVPTITSVISDANQTLKVNFTAPSTDGGSSITTYEYSINGGTSFATRPTGTTASPITITGLLNNTSYDVQIKAVNGIGSSSATGTTSQTTWLAPNAPTITSVTSAGTGELKVYFTAPVNGGGSAITNYSYTLTGANPYTACSPTVTTSPITISGLTNGTSYDIRLRAINSTGSGINSNLLTGTPTASIAISSSGNISDQPVSSATILTVNSGAELTVNQNTAVSSITVAPGAKLTLNDGVTLSTTGSFTLQNSGTETASFVDNRTDVSPTAIAANVEQAITETNRNWYVAVPVTGQTAAGITLSGAYVVKRNEGAVSWENVTGALTPGVGYIAIASASSGTTTWTLSGGNLNSGKVEVPVTRSGASSVGFNLLGNPYASYLNWEQVLNLNATNATLLQPSIWYRTKVGASYAFQSYNSAGRVAVPTSTSGYIPPMQAFWVRANSAGDVTFTNAMRSHGNGSSNVLKAPKSEIQPLVRLQLSNTQNSDEAVLYFNSNASNALDNYDTYKMLESATATKPEIYTQVESEKLVINGMTSIPYNVEIPIGIVTRQAGDFSIAVNELSNFDANTKVILIDKLNPANELDLTSGTPYNFSAPETSATTDRFSLLFRAPGNTTSLNNTDKLRTSVYVNSANKITIIAPEKSNYSIFNSVGQLVDHGKTIDKIHVLNLNKNTGIFVVKVNDVNERIIIK